MSLIISIHCDDDGDGHMLAHEMLRRFGRDRVDVRFDDDMVDDFADDEDEVDEDMLLTILQGATQRMGDSPEARQLGQLIHALQAPPAQRRDELTHPSDVAPPHGIERPLTLPFAKPNPTHKRNNTPERKRAVDALLTVTTCPQCHAGFGKFCRGQKPGDYNYQHVHQARIDLVTWAAP